LGTFCTTAVHGWLSEDEVAPSPVSGAIFASTIKSTGEKETFAVVLLAERMDMGRSGGGVKV
jgi:hypothetical protein